MYARTEASRVVAQRAAEQLEASMSGIFGLSISVEGAASSTFGEVGFAFAVVYGIDTNAMVTRKLIKGSTMRVRNSSVSLSQGPQRLT